MQVCEYCQARYNMFDMQFKDNYPIKEHLMICKCRYNICYIIYVWSNIYNCINKYIIICM